MRRPATRHLCKKCHAPIPLTVVIDGVRKRLLNGARRHRQYCLICSPFGAHNNQQLEKLRTDGLKTCKGCERDFPRAEFKRRGRNTHEGRCAACRADARLLQKREFKRQCVELLGGKCAECGYAKCLDALSFHHKDPTQKDFEISRAMRMTDAVIEELRKCVLLCLNCHAEAHVIMRAPSDGAAAASTRSLDAA
jgi:hypothetical protein